MFTTVKSEIVCTPTNHAVNRAKEHRALGGCGTLAQVLQHQRAMAEDVDKLAEVEHPHLLQVLPLLVSSGRTDHGKDGRREAQRGERKSGGGGGHKHGWNRCDVERSWDEQTESESEKRTNHSGQT